MSTYNVFVSQEWKSTEKNHPVLWFKRRRVLVKFNYIRVPVDTMFKLFTDIRAGPFSRSKYGMVMVKANAVLDFQHLMGYAIISFE